MPPEHRPSLDDLLSRIDDPDVRADVRTELTRRGAFQPLGLVFEESAEEIDLVGRRAQRGDRVQFRSDLLDERRYIVTAVDKKRGTATLDMLDSDLVGLTGETSAAPITDLLVTVDHDTVVHPGLRSTGAVGDVSDRPAHVAIKGDNLHILRALTYTHRTSIDCIYIDPPYNTGEADWIYNDRYSSKDDAYRHSKWLSFMQRRLKIARELLKSTGVIIVAIGDDEHHRLRMLMDAIFGETNFVADVVWQGGRKNDSRFVSTGADYMLIYTKDKTLWAVPGVKTKYAPNLSDLTAEQIAERGARWWERKAGAQQALAQAAEIWSRASTHAEAQKLYRAWMREFKASGVPTDAVSRFTTLSAEGQPIRTDGNISWPGGGGPKYDVLHPVTGKPCAVPSRGWMYSDPAAMQDEIDAGNIYFGKDHTTQPGGISRLADLEEQVPSSVFEQDRNKGSNHLYFDRTDSGVFPDKRFPNPKDHQVLLRWIRSTSPKDAVILDFFGGSGSTLEAVLRLNSEDDGWRQCIIATSNEVGAKTAKALAKSGHAPGDPKWEAVGVFDYVLRPRIETILTGVRVDGSVYEKAVPMINDQQQRVEFFDLTWLDKARLSLGHDFPHLVPLLWMRAGGRGAIPFNDTPSTGSVYMTRTFGVVFDPDKAGLLAGRITTQRIVYIVTDSDAVFQATARQFAGVETRQLYADYLGGTQ